MIAQVAWVVLVLLYGMVFVAGLAVYASEIGSICVSPACPAFALTPADLPYLASVGVTVNQYATMWVVIEIFLGVASTAVALVIFWRARDEWIGLLSSFTLIAVWINLNSEAVGALTRVNSGLSPLFSALAALGGLSLVGLLYLFPDGRFVPRWTRLILLVVMVATVANSLLVSAGMRLQTAPISPPFAALVIMASCIGVAAQIHRFRRISSAQQRQQTKWTIFGMAGAVIAIVFYNLFFEVSPPAPGAGRFAVNVIAALVLAPLLLLFPITLAFAILRYRLWDIGFIIRRTLVYGVLTVLLTMVYWGSITALSAIFSAISGQQSALAIVVSTLLITALFIPLRTRIQGWIDRRFYRRKYDAQQVLAKFAITARDETDMNALTEELARVVQETMEPEQVRVWLRERT